jgi:hypothetical protein
MSALRDLTRRTLLRFTLGFVAAGTLFTRRGRARVQPFSDDALARRMASLVRPRASGKAIGAACIRVLPSPHSTQKLVAHFGDPRELEALNDRELWQRVHARHRSDLQSNASVEVRGWVLSQAEASLYALVHLLDPV